MKRGPNDGSADSADQPKELKKGSTTSVRATVQSAASEASTVTPVAEKPKSHKRRRLAKETLPKESNITEEKPSEAPVANEATKPEPQTNNQPIPSEISELTTLGFGNPLLGLLNIIREGNNSLLAKVFDKGFVDVRMREPTYGNSLLDYSFESGNFIAQQMLINHGAGFCGIQIPGGLLQQFTIENPEFLIFAYAKPKADANTTNSVFPCIIDDPITLAGITKEKLISLVAVANENEEAKKELQKIENIVIEKIKENILPITSRQALAEAIHNDKYVIPYKSLLQACEKFLAEDNISDQRKNKLMAIEQLLHMGMFKHTTLKELAKQAIVNQLPRSKVEELQEKLPKELNLLAVKPTVTFKYSSQADLMSRDVDETCTASAYDRPCIVM